MSKITQSLVGQLPSSLGSSGRVDFDLYEYLTGPVVSIPTVYVRWSTHAGLRRYQFSYTNNQFVQSGATPTPRNAWETMQQLQAYIDANEIVFGTPAGTNLTSGLGDLAGAELLNRLPLLFPNPRTEIQYYVDVDCDKLRLTFHTRRYPSRPAFIMVNGVQTSVVTVPGVRNITIPFQRERIFRWGEMVGGNMTTMNRRSIKTSRPVDFQ